MHKKISNLKALMAFADLCSTRLVKEIDQDPVCISFKERSEFM